jgi:hypothetical protein
MWSLAAVWALGSGLALTFILDVTQYLAGPERIAIRALALLFSVGVPGLMLLGYHSAGDARVQRALLCGTIALTTVLLALPVLYAFVPHYPRQGPHEIVAVAIAACPTLLTIVGASPFAARLGHARWLSPAAPLFCGAVVAFAVSYWGEPQELRLPLSACVERRLETDMKDYRHESLRVQGVPRDSAEAYARALGLQTSDGSATCGPSQIMGKPAKPTWQPPMGADVWTRTGTAPRSSDRHGPEFENCRSLVGWYQGTLRYCLDCGF